MLLSKLGNIDQLQTGKCGVDAALSHRSPEFGASSMKRIARGPFRDRCLQWAGSRKQVPVRETECQRCGDWFDRIKHQSSYLTGLKKGRDKVCFYLVMFRSIVMGAKTFSVQIRCRGSAELSPKYGRNLGLQRRSAVIKDPVTSNWAAIASRSEWFQPQLAREALMASPAVATLALRVLLA